MHGITLPAGLQESQKLEQPLWTPSTKAELGAKDENISPEEGRYLHYSRLKAYDEVDEADFWHSRQLNSTRLS